MFLKNVWYLNKEYSIQVFVRQSSMKITRFCSRLTFGVKRESMTKTQQLFLMFLLGVDSLLKKAHDALSQIRSNLENKINLEGYDSRDDDYEEQKRRGL